MWYSKHHYAAELAKIHGVYFISPPDKWRWKDLFSFGVKASPTPEGVNVLLYRNNLPLRILPQPLASLIDRLNAWKLSRWMRHTEVLFWCFHPTRLLDHNVLRRSGIQVVYHVVDPYQTFSNDSDFARKADMIVAINSWYLQYYLRYNHNTLLIPHGVRDEDRMIDEVAARTYRRKWGPYAVMAAGINHRTNYSVLIAVARNHPDMKLVLVGPLAPLEHADQSLRTDLLDLANVVHVGTKHPDELRNIIRGAEVGLVTYDFEPTRSEPAGADGTPLKVITYLSQLRPVVTTINSYIPELDGRGSFKAENEQHFLELFGQIRSGHLQVDTPTLNRYLDRIAYQTLIRSILDRLHFNPIADLAQPLQKVPDGSPVLVISNEAWDGPRYSKHRYALALMEHRPVYFVDPARPWRLSHPFRWKVKVRKAKEGLIVLSYNNAMPLLGGRLRGINDRLIASRISRFLRDAGRPNPLVWSFDPARLTHPSRLAPCISVYHCADDYSFGWGERQLATNSDHVFCIARPLMPRFRTLNSSIHLVPHGISREDEVPIQHDVTGYPTAPGYGLYIGNINDRHDFELWDKFFTQHPDITWLLVGPVNIHDRLGHRLINGDSYPNVRVMGSVPYERLRQLIDGAAFGFLYLKPDHPANRISSQKVVQFLAQGKPFFCSWFSEYADRQNLVYMTDSHESALERFAIWKRDGEPVTTKQARLNHAEGLYYPVILDELPFQF